MKLCCYNALPDTKASAALLILRLVAGTAFMLHGWMLIQHPFNWMGPDAHTPAVFQFLAAFSELFGGLAWILGLLTPWASLGLLCTMAVAVHFHVTHGHPFVANAIAPSFEPALNYFCVSLVLLLVGPGRFSLDAKIFGKREAKS